MSFLFPAFLFGALAVAVPIVLHLLRRTVAPEVPFTAVRLLVKTPLQRSRKRRLRDLALLAARVAALLLLAIAFARPYIRGGAAGAGDLRIVAIDRSFSMDAPGRFDRALDLARRAIDEAGAAEQVAVLAFADETTVLAGPGNAGEARAALTDLRPGFGATRYAPLFAKASDLASGRAATLVVVSDLQRAGWDEGGRVTVPETLALEVRDVGAPPANLALVAVKLDGTRAVATITNDGPSPRDGRLRAVGAGVTREASFTAPPRGSIDVPVAVSAGASGALSLSIDDQSGLAGDNARFLVLDSRTQREVVLVTGAGPAAPGAYVAAALEAWMDAPGIAPLSARAVRGSGLATIAEPDLARVAAVVLLSTRGLDARGRDAIARVVRRGGGVLVTSSPEVESSIVSAIFDWKPPLKVAEQARAVTLSATDPRHPIFRPFGGLAANLAQVQFARTWRAEPAGWDVIARFTDGAPALLERQEGAGRVLLFASDVDRRWNDFPLHAAFVPFAGETIRYLSGGGSGEPVEYLVASVPEGVEPRPGVYQVEQGGRRVAVNADPRESLGERLTTDAFAAMVSTAASPAAVDRSAEAQEAEAGQGYWRYGLILMIAALIAESFVGKA